MISSILLGFLGGLGGGEIFLLVVVILIFLEVKEFLNLPVDLEKESENLKMLKMGPLQRTTS